MVDGHADHARGAGRRERLASLLDLAAADDAAGFRAALDAAGSEAAELVDEVELWYGRSKAYEPRTPLMVAATCGSAAAVALLLGLGCVDVNRRPGVDGATALHCAASGGSPNAVAVVRLLLAAGADPAIPDSAGRVPADVVHAHPASPDTLAGLEALLGRRREFSPVSALAYTTTANGGGNKKAYPVDPTLPDMSSSVYASDEFRMFAFKVQPCARAYAHEWTECPFVHPGENARRRDPRRHAYTAVLCDSFQLADGCPRGDSCDFAHGVFESWLHPSRYRTRLCRDGAACSRRICFFAHAEHELRYMSRDGAGTALLSPRTMDDMAAAATLGLQFPRSPTGGHFLQQGSKRYAAFDACLEEQVDELSALFDFASLSRSQPRLASIRRPSAAPPLTYMALPPSRFGNDHGASVYTPQPAQTSQLLARIRQQQGVRLPPVKQREMFERPFSCPTLKHHHLRSPPVTARGYSDASWINAGCPGSKVDWSFNAEELLRSP